MFSVGDIVHWYVWDKDRGLLQGKISSRNYVNLQTHEAQSAYVLVVDQSGVAHMVPYSRLAHVNPILAT